MSKNKLTWLFLALLAIAMMIAWRVDELQIAVKALQQQCWSQCLQARP